MGIWLSLSLLPQETTGDEIVPVLWRSELAGYTRAAVILWHNGV